MGGDEWGWVGYSSEARCCAACVGTAEPSCVGDQYLCVCVRVHACVCTCSRVCVYACACVHTHAHACTRIHACVNACMRTYGYALVRPCMFVRVHSCMHAWSTARPKLHGDLETFPIFVSIPIP